MKAWMKALVWFGLGGGIGFFAGYRAGYFRDKKEIMDSANELLNEKDRQCRERMEAQEKRNEEYAAARRIEYEAAMKAQREYLTGADYDGDTVISEEEMPEEVPEMPGDPLEEEVDGVDPDGDIPEEEDEDDEDEPEIRQLHPEDLRPFAITRSEFMQGVSGYDKVQLDYYTEDGVIFDPNREEKWTHPEQLLGLGWSAMFIGTGRVPVREAFVQNDTMQTLYQITRIDDSFERLYEEE